MHRDVRHLPRCPRLLGALSLCLLLVALVLAPSAYAEAYGGLEGKVTDASSRDPIQGIEVCAFASDYELLGEQESEYEHAEGCEKTAAGGEYEISGLSPGGYYVVFFSLPETNLDYVGELYSGASELSAATLVPVTAEKTTPNIEAQLSLGAEISGRLTDAQTGAPVAGAYVCALRTSAKSPLESLSCAFSEANGEYTLRGLPSGSYKLGFVAKGFEIAYYNGKSTAAEADAVSVVAPGLTTGIDDALTPGTAPLAGLGTSPPGGSTPGSNLPGSLTPRAILSLIGRRLKVMADGRALVKVACAGPSSCTAKLTLRATKTTIVKGERVRHTVAVGTSPVLTIAAGRTQTDAIRLDSAARAFLGGHGELRVELLLATLGHKQDESVLLVERKR
jgi:carboxypeptidase family protein